MEIRSIEKMEVEFIRIEDGENVHTYIRFGENDYLLNFTSDELMNEGHNAKDLEKLYQEKIKHGN